MAVNTKAYIEKFLKVRNKKSKVVPFVFNVAQNKVYEAFREQHRQGKPKRVIMLKSRQVGGSTLGQGLTVTLTVTNFNTRSAVIAHKKASTKALFNMAKSFYEGLPDNKKPHKAYSNDRELVFDKLNSYIIVETAGGKDILRGETMNNLHLSEMAYWGENAEDQMLGLMQAVPEEPNTMIFIESTANGFNYFKDMWDSAVSGESDFIPVFVPWKDVPEYTRKYTGFKLTTEEEELKLRYNLTNDQLEWRRATIINKCKKDVNKFRQEYPITPEEAFLSSGDCVFNKDLIIERIRTAPEPIKRGEFIYKRHYYPNGHSKLLDIQFIERPDGAIKIWEEPINGQFYVAGGDTAGDGSDNFEGQFLHLKSGKQVATLTHLNDEDYFVHQMYCLGKYYNWSKVAIENNFSTYPTKELQKLDYPNQFARQREDRAVNEFTLQLGVKTTSITRPLFISYLKNIVNNDIELINDKDTLRQMLTFIKNKKSRAEADVGKHDDKVMSLGIAYYVREQTLM